MSSRGLILLGAGGHAKVLLDILHVCDQPVLGVCDPALAMAGERRWRGVAVLGGDEAVLEQDPAQVQLVNALGGAGRQALQERFTAAGYDFATLVHPSVVLGSGVKLAQGVQLMVGVIIQADVEIGPGTIVNTAAQVDHDCRLAAHVHLAPGAVLAGEVSLGEGVFVGPGAVIGRGVSIGDKAVVGAGTTVVRSLDAGSRVLGNSPSLY